MEQYTKIYHIAVKNNPCFINHKINNEYVMPLDGFFELILIYLIKKKKLSVPLSFKDLRIKHLLRAENLHSEKCIKLTHDERINELTIEEVAAKTSSILSAFLGTPEAIKDLQFPKVFANHLSLQELYIQEHSEVLPFYHSVQNLSYDEQFALATIESSLDSKGQNLFYNDVTVLNGVFIALINFHMRVNHSSQLALPFYIRSISFLKNIEPGPYALKIERGTDETYSLRLIDKLQELVFAADGVELNVLQEPIRAQIEAPEPIAIIGISGCFPKAKNLDTFWKNLCQGYDGISSIGKNRRSDFISTSNNQWEYGGFLEDISSFDARFFDISGHEALSMEPQQRLFLESAWEALEQSGYSNQKQLNCGVYLGITQGDYLAAHSASLNSIPQSFWGNAPSIAASRISYFLDLKGPALALDTACSSSLTALHLACEQLRSSDLALAIAGGVFITVTDTFHQQAARAQMLSPDHQCHAFSAKANGFVPGEAVGAVVLKRLSQAEQDGDFIHALILGSCMNQDGRTNGITAPNPQSQTALQKSVYEQCHINPEKIGYIEAHGTGTKLGDPMEVAGLQDAFSAYTKQKQFCALGSIKSNIGHSAAASGIAGLIKVCLSLKHQTIPVSRHTEITNPEIDFKNTAFFPALKTAYWPCEELRMAGINSFGFSGTNVHVVVQEYVQKVSHCAAKASYFFPFSAKSDEDLLGYFTDFAAWLVDHQEFSLATISYTLSCKRKHFEHRFIIEASSKHELMATLNQLLAPGATLAQQPCSSVAQEFLSNKDPVWLDYFHQDERHTVPLPTYHWQKTKYWPQQLHSNHYFAFNKETIFLKDHVVGGLNILPAAAYLSLSYAKIEQQTSLTNIYFLSPFIVEKEERLVLELDEAEQRFSFKQGDQLFCQGEWQTPAPKAQDLNFNLKEYPNTMHHREIYAGLLSLDLAYGDSLKKLQTISFDETELWAHAYCDGADDLISILDMALQATLAFNTLNQPYLPFYIKALTIHSIPANEFYILARKIASTENSMSCNLEIFDANRQLCLLIEGVEARVPAPSAQTLPKLYFRVMAESLNQHFPKIERAFESGLVVRDAHLELYGLPNLHEVTLNLDSYSFDFISHYQDIYVVTETVFPPEDLTLIRWIYHLLKHLVSAKGPEVRLVFIFNEKNCVQIAALEGLMHTLHLETEKLRMQLIQTTDFSLALKNAPFTPLQDAKYEEISNKINQLPRLKQNGVYLISGGSGGIGLALAEYLIATYQAKVIILSRKIIKESNPNIHHYPCDITKKEAVTATLTQVKQDFSHINGLFHLAGILEDKLFVNSTWDSFYQVLAPKQLGVVLLDELTKTLNLDFFCCFSSLSSFVGNPGQSAYAYANSFLVQYMNYRSQLRDGVSQAIHWPLWDGAGMGAQAKIRDLAFKRWKLPALSTTQAFSFLEQSLASGHTHVVLANEFLLHKRAKPTPEKASTTFNLHQLFAQNLKIPLEEVQLEKPFLEYGIDSLIAVDLIEQLSLHYGDLPKSLLFELTNLTELTDYLAVKKPELKAIDTPPLATTCSRDPKPFDDHIAIIGMAGKYPNAANLDEFWHNLREKKQCISSLATRSEHHWSYSWAGLIEQYDYFDPLFFGISPLDAIIMDPQERQLLQTAYHALEHAGYPKQRLAKDKRVGVFVGVMYGLYQLHALDESLATEQPVVANSTYASFANRVSYCLDLHGPSMAVDSMCSSSLTAIHLGMQSLLAGETNMVLCAGVNLITHPAKYIELQQKSFLAKDGLCHSFAEGGNGYVPGEGVGALVLKRLSDAQRDKDKIYGVIRASALNHGGFSAGYTVPRKLAQQQLLQEVLDKSGLKAQDMQYIEAHGTGTELGDPIEFRALSEVYQTSAKIVLGSLKSNVGHLESAAGVASVTKILLQMQHQELTPHLMHGAVNPNLLLDDSCFVLAQEPTAWTQEHKHAAISSFGAGGANAHLIVSNYVAIKEPKNGGEGPYVLCVSAHTKQSLKQKWQQLQVWLGKQANVDLCDLSYTLALGRDHFKLRSVLICHNNTDLAHAISQFILDEVPEQYFDHKVNPELERRIADYLNHKPIDFDSWFDGKQPTLLELPLYPFDESRFHVKNVASYQHATLSRQKWCSKAIQFPDEAPLIEQCLIIIHGADPQIMNQINPTTCFVLDLANHPLEMEQSIKWLVAVQSPKIVDLVGLSVIDNKSFEKLFILYQNLVQFFAERPLTLYSFYSLRDKQQFLEYSACLSAFFYVLKAEHHLLDYRAIEMDSQSVSSLRGIYFTEQQHQTSTAVKYERGIPYVPEFYVPTPSSFAQKKINPQSYYLITGGSSGIGYLTAQHLVQLGAKKLILMGGTTLPEQALWHQLEALTKKQQIIIQNLSALMNKGVELIHSSCSLTQAEELAQFLQPYKHNIAGLIHAAGLTDVQLERIINKKPAEFQDHLNVKYRGLKNILKVMDIEHLDFAFVYSSSSAYAVKEARGISSYAFANQVMDKYIDYLSSIYPGIFLAIRWPMWRESTIGQMSQAISLETTEAFALFDALLQGYRDGVINVALRPKQNTQEQASIKIPAVNHSMLSWLTEYFITHLKIPAERIDLDKSFIDYGIDSILILNLINALEAYLGQAIAPAIILENPTLKKLAAYFYELSQLQPPVPPSKDVQQAPAEDLIAIIGISGRFPGAENVSQFWEHLKNGYCGINSVPKDRVGEITTPVKAGFIKNLKHFDPHYFGFSDEYAKQLDPLIRLSLELNAEAILNAGYELHQLKGENCAVLVAARAANYVDYLKAYAKDTVSGIGQNFLAAQVSQYFNCLGPSYVVDSACSSSLAAIYLGCQHLKQNDADYALVTGVELLLDNRPFDLLRAGGALSATQSCNPFSAHADGIVLGEGGGTILLKRLKDALRDGDKIEALIQGGAINNDGQTMGITTPNPQSQTAVVKQALVNAGIKSELISYIEAHATGTAIGDPMELAALKQVFAMNKKASCAVGSVKANIGHLLSAAGMASILKVVLSLKHQQIPQSIGCDSPNPRFQFADSPFYLLKDNLNWTSEQPRYAGVSGFGFGGTNVHLILSEFSTLEYQPQRVALPLPKYNKKYIWPSVVLDLSDEMDSFFDIKALEGGY